ncbi:MAG: AAA family ATPase [Breznakia sp.]
MNKLKLVREKQIIKVITGVRRCGKSTLFKLFQEYLLNAGVLNEQIISINLEDLNFESLLDYKELYRYIESRLYNSCQGN